MSAVLFGALAAFANAGQALISKELTLRAPARQLIGVLYAGNCLVLLPFAPFVAWVWSGQIVALHLVSVALMVVTAICVWDLLDHGAASATTTATAMSPIPAALAASVVLPGAVSPLQIVAAAVVVAGTTSALLGLYRGAAATARTARTGVLLQPSAPSDGEVLGVRAALPDRAGPGRGLLVLSGEQRPVQIAR